MIYTFYSYKGGVGRSMALANVAELFYRAGLKVLMVDWDLEAPGLERFFPIDYEDFYTKPGVIDLLLNYKQKMTKKLKPNELPFENPKQFLFDIYPNNTSEGKLWLLSAGKRSKDKFLNYANHVKHFDWKKFYEEWDGELYLEFLRRQLEQIADVILIDSRTGISEIGVCTYQLADVIVMLTSANQQSLNGTHNMLLPFTRDPGELIEKRNGRPLEAIVIPAKVEYTESTYLDKFQKDFVKLFTDKFWKLCIPYTPKYAYEERLAIPEKDREHAKTLVKAFIKLTVALSRLAIEGSAIREKMPERRMENLSRIDVTRDIYIIGDEVHINGIPHRSDWGKSPDRKNFFGRTKELSDLKKWIIDDSCQMVAILGMGGIGKTDFSLKLAQNIENEFDYVIWRSLRDAPNVNKILGDIIKHLSDQSIVITDNLESQLSYLLNYLRLNRCLLILDNVEAVLKGGETAGNYREGYEGYGKLFKLVGESNHKSCLLLTSRETPLQIAQLAGEKLSTRSLELSGLNVVDGRELSEAVIGSLTGEDEEWEKLIELYNGNPLALELAVRYIDDVFFGSITDFLKEDTHIFEGLKKLLDWHFHRLSEGEREIMYWLAIDREPVPVRDLIDNVVGQGQSSKVISHIQSLKRRFPLEVGKRSGFSLQPVILEYMTEKFIDEICQEIKSSKIKLFNNHALIKANAKDHIRNTQKRLILEPIVNLLTTSFGNSEALEDRIAQILVAIKKTRLLRTGYAGGNILNLLIYLESNLSKYDFSRLDIRQAYLQDVCLQDVNFTAANFIKASFTETFSSLLSVAFSPKNEKSPQDDGKYLATGDADGGIRIWRVSDLVQCDRVDAHSSWVRSIAFSPDGTMLASGSDDQKVKLWSFDRSSGKLSPEPIKTFSEHAYRVRSVAFNPKNSNMLASSSYDKTVKLWDVKTRKCQKTLKGHKDWVWTAIFSQDGSKLVSSSKDRTLKIWDVSTGTCLQTCSVEADIQSVAFSPDGKILAAGSDDKTVKFWNFKIDGALPLAEHAGVELGRHDNYVRSVAFDRDGNLASAGYDNIIILWDVKTRERITTSVKEHTHRLRSIAFHPDGQTLASGGWDKILKLWNVRKGIESSRTLQSRTDWICGADISPDGKFLVSGSDEKIVKLWDVKTGKVKLKLEGHETWVWAVAFSPNGKLIASGSFDRTIKLWDSTTGKCLYTLKGHQAWVWSVAFSPDGKLLASGGDESTVKIWDVATGKYWKDIKNKDIKNKDSKWVRSVAFSPDSKFLAIGSDDCKIRIWDVATSSLITTLEGHKKRVRSVAFSPDLKTLASGSYDFTVKIWDTSTGECLKTLEGEAGHTDQVRSVAFSRDGNVLASGGNDRTVRLWHPSTWECFKVLEGDNGHTDEVRSVAFSRNQDILISSSKDGTIRLWDAKTGDFIKRIREPRPYEGMNITDATGLSDLQKDSLKALGSIEY
jgi:WD40 repeat protein/MinD-like ATPase involved in chromosome partitioning or flagellar assembly